MFNQMICVYLKYQWWSLLFIIMSLFFLPIYSTGNSNSLNEVTILVRFTDPFETAYADFQLRFFNESQVVEITSVDFEAKFRDVVEVDITKLTLTVEKLDKSLQKKGTAEIIRNSKLNFNQTGISKNQSWGQISYGNIHYLMIDFQFNCVITYEGLLSNQLIPYTLTLETNASVKNLLFEVSPSPDIIPVVFIGLFIVGFLFVLVLKK